MKSELDVGPALWVKARNKCFGVSFEDSKKLAKLLDVEYQGYVWYQCMGYTPRLLDQLKALAGPHTHTIKAILEARKGYTQ